ncbi:MAG TPA: bifunctional tetrahydrofolate synthase/dihydrofolate synthase [Gammaproteobacteria bacterium]|nr:bifunctional tetrahydrofolate synthase/dihydrofolate synthase [Gammaproteobacteria bacterium]
MPRFATLSDWLAWFETLHPKKIDMSLGRVSAVLDALHLKPPPYLCITVGGTNGKGSCVAILESVYVRAGYRVGAFTSPHLWRFNERIRVDGADSADAELIDLFEAIDDARGEISLTYFEFSAVAALLFFARRAVDVAILEVGMGGRLDAVNAVDAEAALIASIDIDHAEWLGPDRESIGREKAGIMRGGRPAVIGDRAPPASVVRHAAAVGASLKVIGRDFDFVRGPDGRSWSYAAGNAVPYASLPAVPFSDEVQYSNAASCIALVESLQQALPVGSAAIVEGLASAELRGRTETIVRDGVEWIFDVAHNPAAARILRETLDRRPPAKRTLAVFGAMHDKDHGGVLAHFVREVEHWYVAQVDSERGASAASLAEQIVSAGARGEITTHDDVAAACAAAAQAARRGDRVLVFGSFYTVGPAMAALRLYSLPS